ncbi:MAG: phosphoadenosine phosphosulfate reductase family protein [Candidatus Methanomethylophilaceae archaeon]|nr:phosphoadenosine phosphosulfate reductase family protein [Candidatus Methanomethylophilaceae archaeon]
MAGERRNSAHGKETFRWCDSCGTLLLGGSCSVCGSEGREFEVNSPGDIRPCMGDSVGIVKGLFEEAFGTSAPLDGAMMFLNKVPGEDRTDEIVAYGAVLGILRFDMRLDRLVLEIRQPGADLFAPVASKNIVTFAGMSGHLKGKTVPGANVTEVVGDFREGETLILRKAAKVGAGIALADSSSLREAERAVKIRDLDNPSDPHMARCSIDGFVESNRAHIKSIAKKGVREIRAFLAEKNPKGLPVTVSFSGGKDSLAAYGLASQAAEGLELINIDTGLEFPETLEYVRSFAEKNKLKVRTARGGNGFWDNVDSFGPPAKDFRWCCKVCKLGPVTDLISGTYPDGTITVEGNRWLESFARSGIGFVTRNPFVPNQINLNPIRSWNAAEVWGYILMFGLDYNPLYDRDFERIGCYLCPSCLSSEWRNTGRIHPELYGVWEAYLRKYAESRGLPEEYASMGFWRWKVLPPKMVLLAEGLDLRMSPESASNVSMDMLKGASPCAAGGYSMEAVVKMERVRDFSYVEDALRTVGEVKYSPEFEIALLKMPNGRAKLFGGGQVSVTAPDAKNAKLVFERAVKALIRAEMCTECGICEKGCPRHAIRIKGGMRVDPERCSSCGRCEKSCMVIHYYDKLMQGPKGRAPAHPPFYNRPPSHPHGFDVRRLDGPRHRARPGAHVDRHEEVHLPCGGAALLQRRHVLPAVLLRPHRGLRALRRDDNVPSGQQHGLHDPAGGDPGDGHGRDHEPEAVQGEVGLHILRLRARPGHLMRHVHGHRLHHHVPHQGHRGGCQHSHPADHRGHHVHDAWRLRHDHRRGHREEQAHGVHLPGPAVPGRLRPDALLRAEHRRRRRTSVLRLMHPDVPARRRILLLHDAPEAAQHRARGAEDGREEEERPANRPL